MSIIDDAAPATVTGGASASAALGLASGEQVTRAGRRDAEAYVCSSCGYGIRRSRPPHRCPMCQGSDWQVGRARRTRASDGVSGASVAEAALMTLAKRGANRTIHEIASPSSGADPVGFFCECADPECHRLLWFTADGFERACGDPAWHALAPGHRAAVSGREES